MRVTEKERETGFDAAATSSSVSLFHGIMIKYISH